MLARLGWGRVAVGRAGRKRKPGRRHPNGQRVREKCPDDKIRASRQPHRRPVQSQDRLSERAESALGRLALRLIGAHGPLITEPQYQAGQLYMAIVGAYRATIAVPAGVVAGAGRALGCDGGCAERIKALGRDKVDCRCLARRERYDSAFEALLEAGQAAAKAVARVAVWGEDPAAAEDLVNLKEGLDALAQHFGLTRRRSRAHS